MSERLGFRLASVFEARRLADRANILFPGLYAWLLTVGQPVTSPGVGGLVRALAILGLVCLVLGPLFSFERPALSRAFGIYGFVGFSVLAWWQLGPLLSPDRFDWVRAALGAAGWLLYAFGWGKMRGRGQVPEEDPNVLPGPPLPARSRLPWAAWVVAVVSVGAGIAPAALAFRVERPDHAILAHALALAGGAAVLSAGANLALNVGQPRVMRSPAARLNSAAGALALLAVLAVAGLVWMALS